MTNRHVCITVSCLPGPKRIRGPSRCLRTGSRCSGGSQDVSEFRASVPRAQRAPVASSLSCGAATAPSPPLSSRPGPQPARMLCCLRRGSLHVSMQLWYSNICCGHSALCLDVWSHSLCTDCSRDCFSSCRQYLHRLYEQTLWERQTEGDTVSSCQCIGLMFITRRSNSASNKAEGQCDAIKRYLPWAICPNEGTIAAARFWQCEQNFIHS